MHGCYNDSVDPQLQEGPQTHRLPLIHMPLLRSCHDLGPLEQSHQELEAMEQCSTGIQFVSCSKLAYKYKRY